MKSGQVAIATENWSFDTVVSPWRVVSAVHRMTAGALIVITKGKILCSDHFEGRALDSERDQRLLRRPGIAVIPEVLGATKSGLDANRRSW
jgi:hypothetical protein